MPNFIAVIVFAAILFSSWPAHAYIGPAIAFVSYLLGPVVAIVVAVGMILFFPIRAFLRKRKKKKLQQNTAELDESGRDNNNDDK